MNREITLRESHWGNFSLKGHNRLVHEINISWILPLKLAEYTFFHVHMEHSSGWITCQVTKHITKFKKTEIMSIFFHHNGTKPDINYQKKKQKKQKHLESKHTLLNKQWGYLLQKSRRKKKDMKMGTQYSKIYDTQQRQF